MKTTLVSLGIILVSANGALADACKERFTELLVKGNGDVPVEIFVDQEIVGGMKSRNIFRSNGHKQWMSEMIEPDNLPWSMVRDNVMYMSSDKGSSWSKVRDVDSEKAFADSRVMLAKDGETVKDTVCDRETIDGVDYERVAGTYSPSSIPGAETNGVYWLDANGWISRYSSHMKSPSFETKVLQVMEKRDEVIIPEVAE